ncbi:DUF3305 domain-containing protein [Azospirillum halopraeferens]|uniref:DUF3305 domain-containing protein n=1 Tax=Azospirillum halopraeferens TaxID=34010 RepID=UPI0006862445|nr:DUF3305 domain-containing protein [Azospirillum halopraeferens]
MDTPPLDRPALDRVETMDLGIVLERRRGVTPWQDAVWSPVAVIPGAPPVDGGWRLLREEEDRARFHAATLTLELFRTDTEGYKVNLSQEPPRLWVVLRPDDGTPAGVVPFVVTASAHEAEAYQVSGGELVDTVPMPPEVMALVMDFVALHHVDVPFEKRERKRHRPEEPGRRTPPGPRGESGR